MEDKNTTTCCNRKHTSCPLHPEQDTTYFPCAVCEGIEETKNLDVDIDVYDGR